MADERVSSLGHEERADRQAGYAVRVREHGRDLVDLAGVGDADGG